MKKRKFITTEDIIVMLDKAERLLWISIAIALVVLVTLFVLRFWYEEVIESLSGNVRVVIVFITFLIMMAPFYYWRRITVLKSALMVKTIGNIFG